MEDNFWVEIFAVKFLPLLKKNIANRQLDKSHERKETKKII